LSNCQGFRHRSPSGCLLNRLVGGLVEMPGRYASRLSKRTTCAVLLTTFVNRLLGLNRTCEHVLPSARVAVLLTTFVNRLLGLYRTCEHVLPSARVAVSKPATDVLHVVRRNRAVPRTVTQPRARTGPQAASSRTSMASDTS